MVPCALVKIYHSNYNNRPTPWKIYKYEYMNTIAYNYTGLYLLILHFGEVHSIRQYTREE